MIEFQDLCLDVHDRERAAAFWGPALGLRLHPDRPDRLSDGVPEHTLWLNVVPEAKSVKHRVHLDLHVAAVADLLHLGATVVDENQPWTVLADPEGGELCAFVRDPGTLTDYRLYEVVVDAAEPAAIASWWAEQFGAAVEHDHQQEFSWIDAGPGHEVTLVFGRVPEPKTTKNRLHWDVRGERDDLVAAGAHLLRARDAEVGWDVLADPEGNEFCVFAPRGPAD